MKNTTEDGKIEKQFQVAMHGFFNRYSLAAFMATGSLSVLALHFLRTDAGFSPRCIITLVLMSLLAAAFVLHEAVLVVRDRRADLPLRAMMRLGAIAAILIANAAAVAHGVLSLLKHA